MNKFEKVTNQDRNSLPNWCPTPRARKARELNYARGCRKAYAKNGNVAHKAGAFDAIKRAVRYGQGE